MSSAGQLTPATETAGATGSARGAAAWQTRFAEKLCTPARAVSAIRAGEHIYVGAGSASPQTLLAALCDSGCNASDLVLHHLLTLGDAPHAQPGCAGRFRHNALFIGPNVRDAVAEGRADYTPVFLSEIPGLIRAGAIRVDTALLTVSPPDADGYCTFGTHVDLAPAACERAARIIAEVNPHMPRTGGPYRLHVDKIAALVESERTLPELPTPKSRDETEAIARHVAELVPDGATLQLGIGGIPDGVLRFLTKRNDLGIHTEMFSDGVVELAKRGVINGKRKSLHPGKIIASFVLGTRAAYDWLNENPAVELYPSDYVNDPFIIGQHENMIAINTCLQIDLTGQVCSDSIGQHFYSGIGGQVDFIRGAARSRGGRPIIALPSTAAAGVVSRIVPRLDDGAGVVTTRGDVHWVVTEFGSVNLHGLTVRERAMALISIAHPKFRPWLLAEAKHRKLVYIDQAEPPVSVPLYPRTFETRVKTKDNVEFLIRPIKITDEALLRDLFYGLSLETVWHRFFSTKRYMPHESLQEFCTVDYQREVPIVAEIQRDGRPQLIGWAAYWLDEKTNWGEAAFVVPDAWQNRGIGTALMRRLTEIAEIRGVEGFTAVTMIDNARMLRVFEKCGYPLHRTNDGEYIKIRIAFEEPREAFK